MMRPMKLGGEQLIFGEGSLEHLKTLIGEKAVIVTSGTVLEDTNILPMVRKYLDEAKIISTTFYDVEPDPSFSTVIKGANFMKEYAPDWIIAVGGGSAMDAAKAMWIYYEHPELKTLNDILPPNKFPKLRGKAKLVCIPSTSGTASEVSRSIVITEDETGNKHGIGNMEMMPDIAICDPLVTVSMPASLTAATGMDALTHALEAYTSKRANYLTDILAVSAIKDIVNNIVNVYNNPTNIEAREKMLNASFVAGMAFTNVSLGIVHSIAHTLGSVFHIPHGLANAITLPYVINYNKQNVWAKKRYEYLASLFGYTDFEKVVLDLNNKLNIPSSFLKLIEDREVYQRETLVMANMAKADGCTKTNPIIPSVEEFEKLFTKIYLGN